MRAVLVLFALVLCAGCASASLFNFSIADVSTSEVYAKEINLTAPINISVSLANWDIRNATLYQKVNGSLISLDALNMIKGQRYSFVLVYVPRKLSRTLVSPRLGVLTDSFVDDSWNSTHYLPSTADADENATRASLGLISTSDGLTQDYKLYVDRGRYFNQPFFTFNMNGTGQMNVSYEFGPDSRILLGRLEVLTASGWISTTRNLSASYPIFRQYYTNTAQTNEEFNITATGEGWAAKIDPVISSWAYQESANASADGGCTSATWDDAYANTIDGDWATFGSAGAATVCTSYENLSIRPGNTGTIVMSEWGYISTTYQNDTLPQICYNSANITELRIDVCGGGSVFGDCAGNAGIVLYCKNGGTWSLVATHLSPDGANRLFYESGYYQNISLNLSSATISPSNATENDNLTCTATTNGAGTVTYRWFVNGIINASGQTLNRTNYRYNSSVVCEANNTLGSDSILLNSSTLYISDGSAPVLTYWNTSSNNISTGTALTLYANASDYGTVTECRAEVYDNATDATTNHTLAWNGSLWRANIVPSYAGLLNYSALHCVDGSGNWAHNWGVNLTVTVTGPTIPAGGGSTGGGEGGNPPATTTIVNNYGVNASYSFTVLPAVVKPVDTADFLPGSMANRVVQVENKETFDLDMHFIISGNASKYCTMLENVSTPTMQKRSIAVSCTMGAETNEGETYVGNITVVACKPSTSTQCDSRTVSLLLPLAKARQTQLAASIPEDLDNIWQWFAGLRLIEQAEENPIPYGAAFIGLCLLALSFLLMFDLKTGIISRLL